MTTPMFEQYATLKRGCPEAILFFRMGDFYECFFSDAEVVAQELDLTLTARNKRDPDPIPMAGVPHHAATNYIQRLVNKGHRVAIAEQVEDPAKAKGLVRREIVRVVTPGIVLDPTALESRAPNYVMGIARPDAHGYGLAFIDLSTGDFRITEVGSAAEVIAEVHRMEPREALVDPAVDDEAIAKVLSVQGVTVSKVPADVWEIRGSVARIQRVLNVESLAGFGVADGHKGLCAGGATLSYAEDLTKTGIRNLHRLQSYRVSNYMVTDDSTKRNLELVRTMLGGQRKGSLLHLIDKTGCAMGSRMLREWLSFPLLHVDRIQKRQQAIAGIVKNGSARDTLQRALKEVADLERICARVVQGTAHARDLVALRRSLEAVPSLVAAGREIGALSEVLPTDHCEDIARELGHWLVDDPPMGLSEGGFIRRGAHEELDEILEISVEGVGIITRLEATERENTGISTLKIRRNKVFGYYIEVTKANIHRVPERFLRKQTLTNAERYITPELKELEEKVLGADERRKKLEYQLFVELRDRIANCSNRLLGLARQVASLDALVALAEVAVTQRWTCPVVDNSRVITIQAGRHPVVEALMDEDRFVPNDVTLDAADRQLIVLTGPNMSGKSTTMRQVALIVLLAQMGSFVPADAARIGLCDRIFTRVGAVDDLARGQSTFMVEMAETATILHQATDRSLVILDEIGRGTSTYDGLSIAWSVAEDLVDRVKCRAIFATHYHELCELAAVRSQVVNQSVTVSEWGDSILFLRRLQDGGASRSYGIHCADLAGLPGHVVDRARQLLKRFEARGPKDNKDQLSLFGAVTDESAALIPPDPLRERLESIRPDELTPLEALATLYELQKLK
jgi:DNA mismatch repair protein MutS